MKNPRKKIIILIVIFILIILILLASILYINRKTLIEDKNNQNIETNTIEERHPEQEDLHDHEESKSYSQELVQISDYFAINQCIMQYLDILNNQNPSELTLSERQQMTYNQLSTNYIKKNNITIDNVFNHIATLKEKALFTTINTKKYDTGESIRCYGVYGLVTSMETGKLLKELYVIVNLDTGNLTFSIEPLHSKDIRVNSTTIQSIKENVSNTFEYKDVSSDDIVNEYLNKFKKICMAKPDMAYNYLEKEYREKRFGNVDEFKTYVKNRKSQIEQANISTYEINPTNNNMQYECYDKKGFYYLFLETGAMSYNLRLDDYTICKKEMKERYNSSSEEEKCSLNASKIIKMINNYDYKGIYEKLNVTFRKNNFKNQEQLKEFFENHLYSRNKIESIEINRKGDNYICNLELSDKSKTIKQIIKMNIIMQLKEDTDFEMSFSFK